MKKTVMAGSLALALILVLVPFGARALDGAQTVAQQDVAQQAIPDAPRPQTNLPIGTVAPGQGSTSSTSNNDTNPGGTGVGPASATPPGSSGPPTAADQTPTIDAVAGQGADAVKRIRVQVNEVEIPFTVKDSKNQLVAGLKARDIQVYENNLLQKILVMHDDPLPMSVALVIDQSMTQDQMDRVNTALGALQDAFTKYDEVAVFTYNKSTKNVTAFTGAASPRLTQAIEKSKSGGRDSMMAGSLSGPLSQTTVINNANFDPNTAAVRGHTGMELSPPREIHPLNDAILAAATSLSTRPVDFRRVIYVISNGNEYGSKAKTSEVIKYLLTNGIEVDGTLVGDSSLPVLGFLDRMHLPLMMRDNVMIAYQKATGGNIDSEFRTGSIEKSFARVATEARSRYTIAYVTHEPFIDGKYRKIEVRVMNHGNNLQILAKPGYWPAAMEMRPRTVAPTQ